jgi:dipeptidyl aminopeptidase/acylaminoacyl peptidase
MTNQTPAPYGSWKSPITSDLIAAETIRLGGVFIDAGDVYWLEMRPGESGRYVLVGRARDGNMFEVIPAPFNARTRVHEYGGGSVVISGGTVWFSNFSDQRLYRQDLRGRAQVPQPVSPVTEAQVPQPVSPVTELRYADGVYDSVRDTIICVREDHTRGEHNVTNTIVAVDASGRLAQRVLVEGNDFYSSPRLSPDGSLLAWLTWNHPNMPWDGTELWAAQVTNRGELESVQRVAGGADESICQPEWSPDGHLYFVSDRSGWWNIYRYDGVAAQAVCCRKAEFGRPQWNFGLSSYAFESSERIICTYSERGTWRLAWLRPSTGRLELIDMPYTDILDVRASPGRVVFLGGSPSECEAVVTLDTVSGRTEVLRRSNEAASDSALRVYFSKPEPIEFSSDGATAHGLFYPPSNPDYTGLPGEKPPLLVETHGGPTAAASSTLEPLIQPEKLN